MTKRITRKDAETFIASTSAGLVGRRYVKRVSELEAEGMTTSDAQAVADAELYTAEVEEDA